MVCWWLAVLAVLATLSKCDTSNENDSRPAKVAHYDR